MEKKFKFSEFVNVLKIFNENLDIVDELFSQKRDCASLLRWLLYSLEM